MGIKVPEPPKESVEAFRSGLKEVVASGDAPMAFIGVKLSEFKVIYPHKVFQMTLEDLAAGAGLERASLVGWRYLMSRHNIIAASVDVACDKNGTKHKFSGIDEGPHNGPTQETIIAAEQKERVKSGTYELNVMKIRELYVVALWLRELNARNDLIIPLHPTHDSLQAGRAYLRDEFLKKMSETAQEEQLGGFSM